MRLSTIPILFLCLSLHAQNFVWGHSPPAVAPGGIAIVSVTTNALNAAGTSLTVTIPATTAGNCVVLTTSDYNSHSTSFTTNGVAATFQITTNCYIGDGTTQNYIEGWYLKNCGAGITTVVINTTANGANPGYITATVTEVSGLSTTAPYTATERMASANGGIASIPTQDTGGSINNGTAVSIFFGVVQSNGNGVIGTINASGSDGTWTEASKNNGSVSQDTSTVYQIVSSSSSRKHVWNRANQANASVGLEFILHQ